MTNFIPLSLTHTHTTTHTLTTPLGHSSQGLKLTHNTHQHYSTLFGREEEGVSNSFIHLFVCLIIIVVTVGFTAIIIVLIVLHMSIVVVVVVPSVMVILLLLRLIVVAAAAAVAIAIFVIAMQGTSLVARFLEPLFYALLMEDAKAIHPVRPQNKTTARCVGY